MLREGALTSHPLRVPVRELPRESERAARATLRGQIARLERELSDAFLTAFEMGAAPTPPGDAAEPRLLDLEELEQIRDALVMRLREARATISGLAERQEEKRLLLERMLLDPGRHRFYRINRQDLGERGCGAWEVRPRLGLIGMLMGWWQVKLSSGCPLAGARAPRPGRSPHPRILVLGASLVLRAKAPGV
jgi:hypothetical protein